MKRFNLFLCFFLIGCATSGRPPQRWEPPLITNGMDQSDLSQALSEVYPVCIEKRLEVHGHSVTHLYSQDIPFTEYHRYIVVEMADGRVTDVSYQFGGR